MELVNTHCHTGYCGHAEGEIEEYVQAAKKAGLTTLAFTDHYPLTLAFDPTRYISVPPENVEPYLNDVKRAKAEHPEMEIMLGWELDYLGDTEDRGLKYEDFDDIDLVLGSVHYVDRWPFDDPAQRGIWDEEGAPEHIWSRYVDLWCDAVTDKSIRIDVMSHPDLAKKFNYYPDFPIEPLYERMAEAAHESGRMIELNTSGSYYACEEVFPAPKLLQAFCHAEVPCTLGTDAHEPGNVARDIEYGYKLLRDAGYKHLTVPTVTRDRRTIEL